MAAEETIVVANRLRVQQDFNRIDFPRTNYYVVSGEVELAEDSEWQPVGERDRRHLPPEIERRYDPIRDHGLLLLRDTESGWKVEDRREDAPDPTLLTEGLRTEREKGGWRKKLDAASWKLIVFGTILLLVLFLWLGGALIGLLLLAGLMALTVRAWRKRGQKGKPGEQWSLALNALLRSLVIASAVAIFIAILDEAVLYRLEALDWLFLFPALWALGALVMGALFWVARERDWKTVYDSFYVEVLSVAVVVTITVIVVAVVLATYDRTYDDIVPRV